MNRTLLFISIVLFHISSMHAQKVRFNTTFKNYRVSVGGGLGYSPIMLLSPAPFNYKPWQAAKPSLKLELTPTPKFSINTGLQLEHYKYRISPVIGFLHLSDARSDDRTADIGVKTTMLAYTFDIRNYTTYAGYLAPFGRYVMWGFSLNRGYYKMDAFSFSYQDPLNDKVTYTLPANRFNTATDVGIRLGLGKKRYNGKRLKTFFEYQLMIDAKVGDFGSGLDEQSLSSFGGSKRVAYETGMRISQSNSIFQFNLIYGFSF
jgi:hypothetical protein